jgi:hypothetical protein
MYGDDVVRKNQSLISRYLEHIKGSLLDKGISTQDEIITDGEKSKTISRLFKDGQYKGQIRRTFEPLGVELSKIELEGKTGLVDPIYAAERKFFEQNSLSVKTNLVNPITQIKFQQHYPEAMNWGDKSVWRPTVLFEERTNAIKSMIDSIDESTVRTKTVQAAYEGLNLPEATKVTKSTDHILQAIGNTPMKNKMPSATLGALATALKKVR